jgi:hypothetical protein
MDQFTARQQAAGFRQGGADRVRRLVHMQAGEQRHPGIEGAVTAHRFRHLDAVLPAEIEIVLAVAGGDMHEAGAGLGGDEITEENRHIEIIAAPAQRMGAARAGHLGALQHMPHMVGFHPHRLAGLRQQRQRHHQYFAGAGE